MAGAHNQIPMPSVDDFVDLVGADLVLSMTTQHGPALHVEYNYELAEPALELNFD